jgi:UDP-N-acetylmuramyl pentapeptide synthase
VAVLRASNLRSRPAGTEFQLESPFGSALARTRMVGHFNISNALAVLGALLAKGIELRARWTRSKRWCRPRAACSRSAARMRRWS